MDASAVGRFAKPVDVIHAVGYFAPEVEQRLVEAGLESGPMCYFASRSAAMGAVTADVVGATFYNFNPVAISHFIPRAWDLCEPGKVVEARYRGIDGALRRILGDRLIGSDLVAESADLVGVAARAAQSDGRALFAAHASVVWPAEPHMTLWHGLTLLREYRGDGHIMALQVVGLSGLEALITHTATGVGFTPEFARTRRGWSQEQWDDAAAGLTDRGLLKNGKLTDLGTEVRQAAEDLTDDLAVGPWSELGESGLQRLSDVVAPLHAAVIEASVIPDKAVARGWAGRSFIPVSTS